jgi:hypothetical protein
LGDINNGKVHLVEDSEKIFVSEMEETLLDHLDVLSAVAAFFLLANWLEVSVPYSNPIDQPVGLHDELDSNFDISEGDLIFSSLSDSNNFFQEINALD